MSLTFNPFKSTPTDLNPLGLPNEQYLRVCRELPPMQLGVALTGYYSSSADEGHCIEMMMELGMAGDVISELLGNAEFRCEFCPREVAHTKVVIRFVDAPQQFWFDFPHMKSLYCSNGLSLQLAFFDASRSPTEPQHDALACAMGHLDHIIDLAGTLDPTAHPPILAGRALAERYVDFVGNVYRRVGKWSELLGQLRNGLLIGVDACLENKPIIVNMRRFRQSGQASYLGFQITS